MPHPDTEDAGLQTQGIVERLVRDDADRKRFLKGVGSAGAASFGAFVLAACGSSSSSSSSSSSAAPASTSSASSSSAPAASGSASGDLAILNYALTLEYLEAQFYAKVGASGLFRGSTLALLKVFGGEEQTHVDALKSTVMKLGGTPAAKPNGKFPLTSASSVAMLAYTVENLGANAYLGQAGNIKDKTVLAAALSIHSVEARHAAALGTLVKKSISPDGAFAKPADMSTVLAAVKPFLA